MVSKTSIKRMSVSICLNPHWTTFGIRLQTRFSSFSEPRLTEREDKLLNMLSENQEKTHLMIPKPEQELLNREIGCNV